MATDLFRQGKPLGQAGQDGATKPRALKGKGPDAATTAGPAPALEEPGALVDREEDLLLPSGMFVTIHHASGGCSSGQGLVVVLVPPLFEEMPRTRKVMVSQARELALAGLTAVRFDFRGTGLSQGHSEDVTLTTMREDLTTVLEFCRSRGASATSLLGFRLGGYLAAERRQSDFVRRIVLWEPVLDPGTFMKQMLRLEVANQMVTVGKLRYDQKALVLRFEAGEKVLVDGYRVNPVLHHELIGARVLTLTELAEAQQKLRTIFWRTKSSHSEALSLGSTEEMVPEVRFSWTDIRFLQPRHQALFERTIAALKEGVSESGRGP